MDKYYVLRWIHIVCYHGYILYVTMDTYCVTMDKYGVLPWINIVCYHG